MSVCFLYHPEAWQLRVVRSCVDTLASLLETPHRSAVLGAQVPEHQPIVYIGPPENAPEAAAAVVPVEGWPDWAGAELEVASFDGEPILCPRAALSPPGSDRVFPGPWLRSIGFLLAREEERSDSRRDQWECFSGFYATAGAHGVLDVPIVNHAALELARRIEVWCERRHVTLERVPRWKDGARFAAVLSHDVDDLTLYSLSGAWRLLRQAKSPTSYAFRAGFANALRTLARGRQGGDPYWNFDRWVAAEERRGFRSTFYFHPSELRHRHEFDPVYRVTDPVEFEGRRLKLAAMVRLLAQRGFEIGLHGSYLSHRDGEELARQKRQIESASGCAVRGLRQHFLRFDIGSTWSAQERAGFVYDSTLGFNEAIGFRAGIAAPFHPWDLKLGQARRLLELPLTVMDGTLFRTLKLDAARAAERVREHLEGIERAGGLAVLLWHPNAAAEQRFPGWWESYLQTLDHLAARGAWVTTGEALSEWWIDRAARMAASG